ncbi:hypothetical protein PSACC_01322 [Paramicrosporidium saccamoebae]|uniref:F-box domain-containing protein n=1 Tax=Paramicrosporidium saccamoebae TaxID=1246581 RepID=A0A2H9TM75_9FUNG|nr:hypothetical protein PSACC_01322 [Paramicrosporidium saccamoebae]
MESIAPEILAKTFAYLDAADFVWKAAFLQEWGREPTLRVASNWRAEFVSRFRGRRTWLGNMQLACYRFRDVGGVSSARLALDRRSLTLATPECLINAVFASDSKLTRSAMYYSRTYDEEAMVSVANISGEGKFAVGLDNGSLVIYDQIPMGSLTRNYSVLAAPPTRDPLPAQRIDWIGPQSVVLLCRRGFFPTSRLIWWERNELRCVIERNDVNSWCVHKQSLYWSAGGSVGCERWTVKTFDVSIDRLFVYTNFLVAAALHQSAELVFIDPENGTILKRIAMGSNLICLKMSADQSFCIAVDETSNISRIVVEEGAIKVTAINTVPLSSRIKDIASDETIVLVLCEDSLQIYDSISSELLREHTIPGKLRRMSGPDLDGEGHLMAEILSFDGRGRLLVRWGLRSVQFWNFGSRIAQIEQSRRALTDRTTNRPTKTDIARDLNEDLEAYEDAREETAERQRIVAEFTVEGMDEAEMLQYAQLMSMEEGTGLGVEESGCHTTPADHEDEDLQTALRLSLCTD